ncbi:MAG: hypothetical protein V4736_00430 [Bdellovibrionota bacterium]
MKLSALILTLTFASLTFAADDHDKPAGHVQKGTHSSSTPHGESARDNSALFPPKVANKNLSSVAAATTLQSPNFMAHVPASAPVQLKWSAVEGVSNYHLQVSTDPNFKWLVVDETLLKDTQFQVKAVEAGRHYYWRVAGMKPENDAGYLKGPYVKSMFAAE